MFGDLLILGMFLLLAALIAVAAVAVVRSWPLAEAADSPVASRSLPDLTV